MWGEFSPSNGSKMLDFLDTFADLHGGLWSPYEYPEPEPYQVAQMRDCINIRKYFDAAISRAGAKRS